MPHPQAASKRDFGKPEVRAFLERLDLEEHERRRYSADRVLQSVNWWTIGALVLGLIYNLFAVIGFAWFLNALITRLGA